MGCDRKVIFQTMFYFRYISLMHSLLLDVMILAWTFCRPASARLRKIFRLSSVFATHPRGRFLENPAGDLVERKNESETLFPWSSTADISDAVACGQFPGDDDVVDHRVNAPNADPDLSAKRTPFPASLLASAAPRQTPEVLCAASSP